MTRASLLAAFLTALCFSRPALAGAPAPVPAPAATPQQVQQTVDRAIGYIQAESAAWMSTRKCAACHHAAMPLWALGAAERQGYTIDKKFVKETAEATLGSLQKMMAAGLFDDPTRPPDPRPLGKAVKISAAFMAVAARSLPSLDEGQKESLRYIADHIIKKQRPDGGWDFYLSRPPINESESSDAAWLILALQGETGPGASEQQRAALAKATAWLANTKLPDNFQDKVFKVLLSVRAGEPRDKAQGTVAEILALQRADGGWAQKADWPSDAFATGQTLYVLSLAGFTADRPEIKRAINFLVATQKPDGSWAMTSRSTPDGRPGSSKLLTPINCAAGSWATLGLARFVPKKS
jgi:hypothetical protein